MEKYEQDLQKVLNQVDEGFPGVFEGVDGLTRADLQFLAAKELVKLHPAGDNELFAEPTAKGLTYFSDKKDLLEQQVKELSDAKAEKKADRRFQLFDTFFGAVIGALLMGLYDHRGELLDFFRQLS